MCDCDFTHIRDRRSEGKTPLEQAKLVELYILDVFDEICRANGLCYWLDYGTLLGACRHGGFIPWDDDIDVSMPVSDYRKFLRIAPCVMPKSILLQDMSKNANPRWSYAKLRDRKSFYCELKTDVSLHCGIFIDIFPSVKVPKLPGQIVNWVCWVQYTCSRHAGDALSRLRCTATAKMYDCLMFALYRGIRLLASLFYDVLYIFFPSSKWRAPKDMPDKFILEETRIFPCRKIRFEDREYFGPYDPEYVLCQEYGDWRQLPPEEKRYRHANIILATQTSNA